MIKITTALFTGFLTIICGVWAVTVVFDTPAERHAYVNSKHYSPVRCDTPECSHPPREEPPVHQVPVPQPAILLVTGLVLMRFARLATRRDRP